MEPIDQQIWAVLERKSLEALKTSEPVSDTLVRLRMSVLPSFGSPRSWTLLERARTNEVERWEARMLRWERVEDYSLIADPVRKLRFRYKGTLEPTLTRRSVPLEAAVVEEWFRQLSQLSIPLKTSGVIGIDGTSYELRFGSFWNALELRWWSDIPDSWRPVHDLARELLEVLGDSYDA